ncbi:MAG: thiamine phosphate synthase [Gammaproteobacteria bacterium]|nr:thiamine phosphate synthase [Gammaproteobacteria bacterium]MYD80891.1 thiamine phosphate synthase [Gammaproteobacteria bacterium]
MLDKENFPFLIVIADWEFVGETKTWLRILSHLSQSVEGNKQVAVQIRIKSVNQVDYEGLAHEALRVLGPNTRTILNGSLEDAQQLGYWGAHTQVASDIRVKRVKPGLNFVSMSVHDADQLRAAEQSQVSAVLCSPVFSPSWKSVKTMGLQRLRQISQSSSVPVYALGGITPPRCEACVDAGAIGVAVLSGIMSASNPNEAIAEYMQFCDQG